MTKTPFFFVGRTRIDYQSSCSGNDCSVRFIASKGDGFWDITGDADGVGSVNEVRGGHPYPFEQFEWTENFVKPRNVNDD